MAYKKGLFVFIFLAIFWNIVYAGELLSQQAINYYNDGVQQQKSGNLEAAIIAYQKAQLLGFKDMKYQKFIINNLGVIFVQQQDLDKAEAAFNEALQIDPAYKPSQFNLGLVYHIRGDKAKALEYWLKYLGLSELSANSFIVEDKKEEEEKK
jgi:tetratricopeptide (TPR) repeat protein